jgi:hypothetical protein
MKLEEIAIGNNLTGIEPTLVVSVIAVRPIAEGAFEVIYKTPDGTIRDRLLGRADEESINVATVERPWSFDGDGDAFKLAVEAKRIDLAFLFDPMMAVHTSNVEPLPHQITAVYESIPAKLLPCNSAARYIASLLPCYPSTRFRGLRATAGLRYFFWATSYLLAALTAATILSKPYHRGKNRGTN